MQSIFSNALSRAVAKHIGLSATRRETLSWLALLIMQHGTISLWRLAAYVASVAQTASVQRRFYRFFQFVRLDGTHSARVVVELLGLPVGRVMRSRVIANAGRSACPGKGHAVMSVKVRPKPKDSGFEAREAPWRESKTAEPSDNMLERSVREASGCNVQ